MRIQFIAKSLLIAFAGSGLVSFFLMMTIIPSMAVWQRLSGNVAQKSVVVNPSVFMRTYGLPIVIVIFLVIFSLSMFRFRRIAGQSLVHH